MLRVSKSMTLTLAIWQGIEARHACTEADLFLLPKLTTNVQQRLVSR
jgi:hypothetical protein